MAGIVDEDVIGSQEDRSSEKRPAEEENSQPHKRFKVVTEEENFKWSLPEGMADYVRDNFEKYIQEKGLKENIMIPNPKPDNIAPVRRMDGYLTELLKEKRKTQELASDATLEKIQNRTNDIMGPLSRLWYAVDRVATQVEEKNPHHHNCMLRRH